MILFRGTKNSGYTRSANATLEGVGIWLLVRWALILSL
jgi:hypothetical protein